MQDVLALREYERSEYNQINDKTYYEYHFNNIFNVNDIRHTIEKILGFNSVNSTDEYFAAYMQNLKITKKQKRHINNVIKNNPLYKKALGETSIKHKIAIENILDFHITSQGPAINLSEISDEIEENFYYEEIPLETILHSYGIKIQNGKLYTVKTVDELLEEENALLNALITLQTCGAITKKQYDNYNIILENIYNYYISKSQGRQIFLEPKTNAELKDEETQIENYANIYHLNKSESRLKIMNSYEENFQTIQDIARNHIQKNKTYQKTL